MKAKPMPNLPTPADEALAREILRAWYSFSKNQSPEFQKELEKTFAKDLDAAAQLIAAHVAAQAPSGSLLEALEAVDDDDTGVLNTEDTKDFKLGYAAGVKQVQDEVKEIVAAHKAQPVADVRGMVKAIESDEKTCRSYIPLAGGYEFQTKGTGSTARLLCPDGNRVPFSDPDHVIKALEDMAFAQHAALASARHAMGGESKGIDKSPTES